MSINKKTEAWEWFTFYVGMITLVSALKSDWAWISVSLRIHEPFTILGAFIVLAVLLAGFVYLMQNFIPNCFSVGIARAMYFSLLIFFLMKLSGSALLVNLLNQNIFKVFCFLLFVVFFMVRHPKLGRIYGAASLMFIIYVVTPFFLASSSQKQFFWPATSPNPVKTNTLLILLDELSSSVTRPITQELISSGMTVFEKDLMPLGENTINVVPAMFSGLNFSHAFGCGLNKICSDNAVLDFGKIQASSNNIDIVGFYFPYCMIEGLRSCDFEPIYRKTLSDEILCNVIGFKSHACEESNKAERSFNLQTREMLQEKLLQAPFWEHGGVLYAHLLQPHPLMGKPEKSLSEEYQENIANSSALIRKITEEAKKKFGRNFIVVIFADHPLRLKTWCIRYSTGCSSTFFLYSSTIPLIIAKPLGNDLKLPEIQRQSEIFSLLTPHLADEKK